MEPTAFQKKQSGGTSGVDQALWDPFWFMREMFGWGRPVEALSIDAKKPDVAPSFDVKETDGAYVCKFKLTLPDRADVAHVKAKLDKGELTVIVPKAAAATPGAAASPPRKRQTKGDGRGSAAPASHNREVAKRGKTNGAHRSSRH